MPAHPIAEAGGPQSLIEDDLKAAQAEFGTKHSRKLNQLADSISLHVDKFFNRQSLHLNESEIQHEILAVAEGIVRFVEAALAPAKLLRERLDHRTARASERRETSEPSNA